MATLTEPIATDAIDLREPTAGQSRYVATTPEPGAQMAEHHHMARWVQPVLVILAAWLVTSPPILGYESLALTISDLVAAGVLASLAWLAFQGRMWAGWSIAGVGTWLLFAPLLFSAPTAAEWANDTLVGSLVIGLGILVPHGMAMEGPEVPPGWSYNPSTWTQRGPVIALGLLGFFISRYLAAYQFGHIDAAWDPFFGPGTEQILTSDVSRMFPVSDAGLGAVVYALEVLMGLMGDHRRWRTMPWMVAGFGVLVIPLGVAQVVLIMLQPIAVGTWSTLALLSAAGMLLMVTLSIDEVVAMGQLLRAQRRQGVTLWHAFWYGANVEGEDRPSRERVDARRPAAALWGASWPWTLITTVAVGLWLLTAPDVLGTTGRAADSDHLVGAVVITIAAVAFAEPTRIARLGNVAVGAWLLAAPWVLGGTTDAGRASDVLAGAALIVLSLPRGTIHDRYAGWDTRIR